MEHETVKLLRRLWKTVFKPCCHLTKILRTPSVSPQFFLPSSATNFCGRHGHRPLGFIWSMKIGLITNSSWKVWTSENNIPSKVRNPYFLWVSEERHLLQTHLQKPKKEAGTSEVPFLGVKISPSFRRNRAMFRKLLWEGGQGCGYLSCHSTATWEEGLGGFHGMPLWKKSKDATGCLLLWENSLDSCATATNIAYFWKWWPKDHACNM